MKTTPQANAPKQLTWTPPLDVRQIPGLTAFKHK